MLIACVHVRAELKAAVSSLNTSSQRKVAIRTTAAAIGMAVTEHRVVWATLPLKQPGFAAAAKAGPGGAAGAGGGWISPSDKAVKDQMLAEYILRVLHGTSVADGGGAAAAPVHGAAAAPPRAEADAAPSTSEAAAGPAAVAPVPASTAAVDPAPDAAAAEAGARPTAYKGKDLARHLRLTVCIDAE